MKKKCRLIAFYLPQFHPIAENNIWWGEGFTEWTNVGKAKPLYRGHDQPKVPADLGYYDLRVSETRIHQAKLAKNNGIEGFCYWHYWFGNGKKLLERPFSEVLLSGNPEFPFCLAWANESWKGFAHGLQNRNLLISQEYPGHDDVKNHFFDVLPALKDKRYIKVNNKPVFLIYKPLNLPEAALFIKTWNKLALDNGLSGIYFIGQSSDINEKENIKKLGFDSINLIRIFDFIKNRSFLTMVIERIKVSFFKSPKKYNYASVIKYFTGDEDKCVDVHPTIFPNWDHTPRSGYEGIVLHNSTPEYFKKHVLEILENIKHKENDTNIVFIKSWNEWAEGNYLEPDIKFGDKYLKVLKECLFKI